MTKNLLKMLAGLALLAGGCNLAPDYSRPDAPIPTEWPAYATTRPAADAADATRLAWWEFYGDEKLQEIIGVALENNRDLRLAALNVQRAEGMYGIQRAALLPAANAAGAFSRQRVPAELSLSGAAATANQYSVNLGVAAWEIDFFGRLRNLAGSALREYLATEQARRSVRLLLVSRVATAYMTIAADRESLGLARSTLEAQQDSYDLVKRRLERGVAPEVDIYRAQAQVDTARGEVARFTQLVALDENALDLLVGRAVPARLLPVDLSHLGALKEITPGISSEALLLRPDILQAEEELMAAYANIGAARAAFFPKISLTAGAGTASTELSGLFNASSRTWSYAPQVVMPVFDARTWAALRVSKVDREIAVAQYERSIQTGFREVADALAVRATVGQQVSAQESLVRAVAETYRLSTVRYEKGIDSSLDVLDAQRSLFAAQEALISLRLAKLANQVRLYAVLGGGWQEAKDMEVAATQPSK